MSYKIEPSKKLLLKITWGHADDADAVNMCISLHACMHADDADAYTHYAHMRDRTVL